MGSGVQSAQNTTGSASSPRATMPTATINGTPRTIDAQDDRSLLEVLREDLGLTGAKPGCGEGACGACTVLINGQAVRACMTPAKEAAGRTVTTIEGLSADGHLHPVQQAMVAEGAIQCGYCTPGMVLRAVALLSADRAPSRAEIRWAMAGNVCRCCGYGRIERAILGAAAAARGDPREAGHELPANDPDALPRSVAFWAFRPRTPWDLTAAPEREHFELLGDGLVVVLEAEPPATRFPGPDGGAWLHVGSEGIVTAFTGKVEMGQDNRTALSAIVADELQIPLHRVRLAMGDTDLCPFDAGTFGSRSLPGAGEALRVCAASAREWLASHETPHSGTRALVRASREVRVLAASQWRHRGHPIGRATARAQVTGAHRFPSDIERPAMLQGSILQPPAYGARLVSVELERARAMEGVTVVHEGDLLAACASDRRTAARAIERIEARWEPAPEPSTIELEHHLRSHPSAAAGWERAVDERRGDLEGALRNSDLSLARTYTTAYLAHAPLETRVAVAEWHERRLTVLTGTQQPFMVRAELAGALGLDERDVRVIVPDFGGGFGSKHTEREALAAARLSLASGRPVKVALTREEEFRFSYFRPAAVIDIRAGTMRDGRISAWEQVNINAGAAALRSPYDTPVHRVRFQPAASPLPQGPYRALAATANHFARESAVDELAEVAAVDPLQFRLRNLSDERLIAVLRAAAAESGWEEHRREAQPGTGIGIACGTEKGGRVATCIRLRWRAGGEPEVLHVVTAYECGAVINPDNVRRQVEGATVMGLGGALFEAVQFDEGRILNASLRDYRVPRFTDVPPVDVILLDRPDLPPAGAGETPLVAVAPALANAVAAAGQPRPRSLPIWR